MRNKQIDLDTQKFLKGQDDKFNVDAAKIQQGQEKLDQQWRDLELKHHKMEDDFNLKSVEMQAKFKIEVGKMLQANQQSHENKDDIQQQ